MPLKALHLSLARCQLSSSSLSPSLSFARRSLLLVGTTLHSLPVLSSADVSGILKSRSNFSTKLCPQPRASPGTWRYILSSAAYAPTEMPLRTKGATRNELSDTQSYSKPLLAPNNRTRNVARKRNAKNTLAAKAKAKAPSAQANLRKEPASRLAEVDKEDLHDALTPEKSDEDDLGDSILSPPGVSRSSRVGGDTRLSSPAKQADFVERAVGEHKRRLGDEVILSSQIVQVDRDKRLADSPVRFQFVYGRPSTEKRPSQTGYLLYALEHTGNAHAIPPNDERRDNPMLQTSKMMCLQGVLARYILATETKKDETDDRPVKLNQDITAISPADRAFLQSRGYDINALEEWASLLVARDIHSPITALFGPQRNHEQLPPIFLFVFMLKRQNIHARTLQVLVSHAWKYLALRRESAQDVDETTVFAIFGYLLRHARRVWPEAIINVSSIISTYLRQPLSAEPEEEALEAADSLRISKLYNRALSLLARPVSRQPFKSSIYQEVAQFDLLHAMATQHPPLRIKQEGYQALSHVLLSRTKTEQERDWTSLQAKSWPPWMRARTGVDESKDFLYGLSRATNSTRRMMEAGYSPGDWSKIAEIYAGRDVDGSPVVQERMLRQPYQEGASDDALSWEARIRTTRTIREAWACFLSYKNSGDSPSDLVYSAMIVKLLLEHKTTATAGSKRNLSPGFNKHGVSIDDFDRTGDEVQPGDRREPFPEPAYPGDLTYVPSEPPSPLKLFKEMCGHGLQPSVGVVAQLVKHGRTLNDGLAFLNAAGRPYTRWLRRLISGAKTSPKSIQQIPEPIFSSFIQLLCRVPKSTLLVRKFNRTYARLRRAKDTSNQKEDWTRRKQRPALHAMRLLHLRQSTKRQLWAGVLEALSDRSAHLAFGTCNRQKEEALKLLKMRGVLAEMNRLGVDPDMTCFMSLSIGAENAAIAIKMASRSDEIKWASLLEQIFENDQLGGLNRPKVVVQHERGEEPEMRAKVDKKLAHFLRRLFHSIVSGGDLSQAVASKPLPGLDTPPMPRLLATPSGAELHAYVRALGVIGDHEGIWSLVQWMTEHHEALWMQVLEERGGRRRWTLLLSAIRVFLECPQREARVMEAGLQLKMKPAGEDLIALVRDKLNSIPDNKWPDESMATQYVNKGIDESTRPHRPPPSISNYI